MYQTGKEFSVDELVVLFQRRLQFKRCIRMRPCRYGIKLHVFTTSTSIALDWFSGKGTFHESGAHSKMATTERILVILLQSFHGKGHTLFTDNFYNSPLSTIFLRTKLEISFEINLLSCTWKRECCIFQGFG